MARATWTSPLLLLTVWLGFTAPALALDRWGALSLIESGDNDKAKGPKGEVSRFQIQTETWRRYATTNADWTKPEDALAVAKAIMTERCANFEKGHQRPPTDFEFYVLWNAPAQVDHPSKTVSRRAQRFCNLIEATPKPVTDPAASKTNSVGDSKTNAPDRALLN